MNIYQGHKHYVTDIIGIGSISLSGGTSYGGISAVASNGGLKILSDGIAADFGTGVFQIARGSHGHNNILINAGDIVLSNTDGVYSISLSGALSAKLFSPASTGVLYSGNIGVRDRSDSSKVGVFDARLISSGQTRTYLLPDVSGTIMIDGGGGVGGVIRDDGIPPPTPSISNTLSSTSISGAITYTKIVWDFVNGDLAPYDLSYFILAYRDQDSSVWTSTAIMDKTAREKSIIGLMSGRTYYFKVLASDLTNNQSEFSDIFALQVAIDSTAPSQPSNLSLSYLGANSIRATWSDNSEKDLKEYRLYYSIDENFTPNASTIVYAGSTPSWYGQIVATSGTLYFKLCAVDFSGNISDYQINSMTVPITPDTPIVSNVVITSNIEADGDCYINLTFTDSITRINTDFLSYIYRVRKHGTGDPYVYYTGTRSTNFRTYDVIPNTTYDIGIAAININGTSGYFGDIGTATHADTTPPGVPTNFLAIPEFNAIKLTWTNPTDRDFDGTIVYKAATNVFSSAVSSKVYGDSFTDTGLAQGQTYYYWISSIDTSLNKSAPTSYTSAMSIQLLPADLSTHAKVDFILNGSILSFQTSGSSVLSISAGSIIRGDGTYTFSSTSLTGANNSYIIATCVSGSNTATFSKATFSSTLPLLNNNQVIVALTSGTQSSSGLYQCYVRQSNSMSIDGAIIQYATIDDAQIKTLNADKLTAGTISSNRITSSSISAADINADRLTSGTISASRITSASISAADIQGNKIVANTIAGTSLVSNTVSAGQLAADSVTADKILAGAITGDKVAANTITFANLYSTERATYYEDFNQEFIDAFGLSVHRIATTSVRPTLILESNTGVIGTTAIRITI